MKNETLLCEHKILHHKKKIICYRNSIKTEDGKILTEKQLFDNWTIIERPKGSQNSFDIHYISGGVIKEKIKVGANMGVIRWKIEQLKQTTHKTGLLIPVRCDKTNKL